MMDKRSAYDRCVADLEMAQMLLSQLTSRQGASADEIRKAATEAKRLEMQLAATKLAQAEYHLDSLKARLDFLEARARSEGGPTKRELAELEWARTAVPVNQSTVGRLSSDLDRLKQELEQLAVASFASNDAAA